jgi:signal peptidase II
MAGALGNQFDRLVRGHVIDFLDFYVGQAHWPFFNAADSCITIGACLMLFTLFRRKPACSPSS